MSAATTATMVGMALTATTTAMTIADKAAQQNAAMGARGAALNGVMNQTIPSINESLAQSYNSNAARTNQEQDKAVTEKFDILRGMAEAKGTAVVAAGDAGVGGVSFANVLSDFEAREGTAFGKIDYNVTAKTQQVADENLANKQRAEGATVNAINAATKGTPVGSAAGMFAGMGADLAKGGLTIADKAGVFSKKIDPATGVTITKAGSVLTND